MAFKTILTVTRLNQGLQDLSLAADLCESQSAHLAALVVGLAAPPPIGEYAAVVSDAWLQERREDEARLKERAEEVTKFLADRSISADVTTDYVELAGADEAIGQRGQYADLTLLGPESQQEGDLREKIIEGALYSSGRPLLIVPQGCTVTLEPKRVVIAWDARLEVTRATREALEMLIRADDVRLLLVDPHIGEDKHGQDPGADIAIYLARHGIKTSVERIPGLGRPVAESIRGYARDVDAQMIVMGAYGHSRLRERIFGGVTKSMLAETALPTFLAR